MPGRFPWGPPSVSEADMRAGITQGTSPYVGRSRLVGGDSDEPGGRQPAVVLSGSTSTVPHGRQPKTATYYLSSYSSSPRRNSGITVTTIATPIAASITAPVERGSKKIVLAVPNATIPTHR